MIGGSDDHTSSKGEVKLSSPGSTGIPGGKALGWSRYSASDADSSYAPARSTPPAPRTCSQLNPMNKMITFSTVFAKY